MKELDEMDGWMKVGGRAMALEFCSLILRGGHWIRGDFLRGNKDKAAPPAAYLVLNVRLG